MTAAEEKKIFNSKIVPVMDKIHKSYPKIGMDMYFTAIASELRKQNVPLSNNLVNAIMDKMAKDSMPKGTWDYLSGKVLDNNIVKTVFDWTHPSAVDTKLELEIKRRAELMYNASTTEKVAASVATAGTDILATAPVAVLCPQSVAYGFLVQGEYDIVNDKILLPESAEERKATANDTIASYNALEDRTNWKKVPGWMYSKYGFKNLKDAPEDKLKSARDWAKDNAKWWHDMYDKLGRENKNTVNANGKTFTRHECLVKYNQYELFRGECQRELTERYLAEEKAKELARKEALKARTEELEREETPRQSPSQSTETKDFDPWGQLLNTLGFNGLGNVGKHLGLTLATLPDAIFGIFTGKTKSVGMDKDTLIPVASLVAGKFVQNPMLKAALMGYGGLNLINKLGNEQLARRENTEQNTQTTVSAQGVKFRKYDEEPLNPRITNLQIQGNRLIADIDRVPCTITLPDTAVQAYNSGALPLSTLANAILAKNDSLNQQVSQAYEQSQKQEQSRGIR